MAFSWTPIAAGSLHAKSHIQEVKTNTNTLYSKLQLSPFSWSYLANVDALTTIESEHYQEMRNAADYAHDMNYCRTHDATFNSSVNSSYKSTVDTGADSTVCATDYLGVYSKYYAGVLMANDSTIKSSNYYTVY